VGLPGGSGSAVGEQLEGRQLAGTVDGNEISQEHGVLGLRQPRHHLRMQRLERARARQNVTEEAEEECIDYH